MTTRRPTATPAAPAGPAALQDPPVPVRATLAAAWTSFVLLYAYVDILNFYTPGAVSEILEGRVFEFDLSQTFSVAALGLVSVPILMVALSMTLPARANRTTNLVVAALYVPVTVFNLAGGLYLWFYGLGVVLELGLLAVITRRAWTWPRSAPSAVATAATTAATTAAMATSTRAGQRA